MAVSARGWPERDGVYGDMIGRILDLVPWKGDEAEVKTKTNFLIECHATVC